MKMSLSLIIQFSYCWDVSDCISGIITYPTLNIVHIALLRNTLKCLSFVFSDPGRVPTATGASNNSIKFLNPKNIQTGYHKWLKGGVVMTEVIDSDYCDT